LELVDLAVLLGIVGIARDMRQGRYNEVELVSQ